MWANIRKHALRVWHFLRRLSFVQGIILLIGVAGTAAGALVVNTASSFGGIAVGGLVFLVGFVFVLSPAVKQIADAALQAEKVVAEAVQATAPGLRESINYAKLRGLLAAVATIHEEGSHAQVPALRGALTDRVTETAAETVSEGAKALAFFAHSAGVLRLQSSFGGMSRTDAQWDEAAHRIALKSLLEEVFRRGDPLDIPDITGVRGAQKALEAKSVYAAPVASQHTIYGVLVALSPSVDGIRKESKLLIDLLGTLLAAGYATVV